MERRALGRVARRPNTNQGAAVDEPRAAQSEIEATITRGSRLSAQSYAARIWNLTVFVDRTTVEPSAVL
jgi:hypothetical protein